MGTDQRAYPSTYCEIGGAGGPAGGTGGSAGAAAVTAGGAGAGFEGSGTAGPSELAVDATDVAVGIGAGAEAGPGADVTGGTGSTRVVAVSPGASTLADGEAPSLAGTVPSGFSSLVASSFDISPAGVSPALGGSSAPGLPCLPSLCLADNFRPSGP